MLRQNDSLAKAFSRTAVIEQLETRCLRSVSYFTDGSNVDPQSSFFGQAIVAEDGTASYWPELTAGSGSTPMVVGSEEWDPDLSDGFDSEAVGATFSVNSDASHQVAWAVGDATDLAFSAGPAITIHSVSIQATVNISDAAMEWTKVQVQFFHSGTLVEQVNVNDLIASTLDESSNAAAAVAVVTPAESNVDGVIVSGVLRMRANEGTCPEGNDIGGKISVS
ncbi:MAG: hypothetical protein ACTHLZ_09385 [Tepidisphaeraceae bacterium]